MALHSYSCIIPKGEKISVTVEESLEDLVVVSFVTGSRTLRGVLLDTEKTYQESNESRALAPHKFAISGVTTRGEVSPTQTKTMSGKGVRGASQAAKALHVSSKKRGGRSAAGLSKKVMKTLTGQRKPVPSPSTKDKVDEKNACDQEDQSVSDVPDEPSPAEGTVNRAGATASMSHLQLSRGGHHQAKLNAQAARIALAQAKLKRQKIRYHCVGPNRRRRLLRRRAMAARSSSEREDQEETEDREEESRARGELRSMSGELASRGKRVLQVGPRLRGTGHRGSGHVRVTSRGRGSYRGAQSCGEGRASRRTAAVPIGVDNLPADAILTNTSEHLSSTQSSHPLPFLQNSPEPPSSPIQSTIDREGLDMPLSPVLSFHKQAFIVGDVVWAKMVDLPWWPAIVESVRPAGSGTGSTMQDLSLQFLGRRGTSQTTLLPNTLVMPFVQAFRSKFLPKKKTSTYVRAVQEACEMTNMETPAAAAKDEKDEENPLAFRFDPSESLLTTPAQSPLLDSTGSRKPVGGSLSLNGGTRAEYPKYSKVSISPEVVRGKNEITKHTSRESVTPTPDRQTPRARIDVIDILSSSAVDSHSPGSVQLDQSSDLTADSVGSDDDTIQVLEV